jgi:uncharacterized protein
MLIVISPSKTLDFESPVAFGKSSEVEFSHEANQLALLLKKRSSQKLAELMGISPKLAQLNFDRYQRWNHSTHQLMGRQALLAFKGDVYDGMQAYDFSENDYLFAQKHLRILSGLYGLLKPLDLIQPYRLEMGTPIRTGPAKDLYAFWRNKITKRLIAHLSEEKSGVLINLASVEYFSAIDQKKIPARIVTPTFHDFHNGNYKVISFYAKRARGMMSRFIIQNKITDPEHLLAFNSEGYHYNINLSKETNPVFTR